MCDYLFKRIIMSQITFNKSHSKHNISLIVLKIGSLNITAITIPIIQDIMCMIIVNRLRCLKNVLPIIKRNDIFNNQYAGAKYPTIPNIGSIISKPKVNKIIANSVLILLV